MAWKDLMVFAMIFLVSTNARATAFVASGTADAWELTSTPVPEEEITEIEDSRDAFNASEFGGSWVPGFDFVQLAMGILDNLKSGIVLLTVGGPYMLGLLLPTWLVSLIFAPFYLIIGFGVLQWWLNR